METGLSDVIGCQKAPAYARIAWLISKPSVTISPPSTIGRDRYRYVIELGHTLEPLGEAAHNESNKVRGCVSQVWLEREARTSADGQAILHYRGDSDSHLVRGLIAISISLFSDRAPKQILAVDALGAFRALGLEQHLTPQRSNGARAMIERIRADAAAA
jgi:cysteine desulfuration protein SufE